MDIWERMYEKAKEQYHPEDVSPFVYAHHVVCALEAENGEIYTGFCIERELQRGIEFMRRKSGDSQHVCKQWADEDQEVDCIPGFGTFWWRKRHALRCLQRIPLSIKRRK